MSQQFQPPAPDSVTPAPGYPAPPAPKGNVALGIVAAVVAALVAAAAYGGIMNAIDREFGYAAVGVGALVGIAAGKLGGRNPLLPVLAGALSVGAVYAGQLFYLALVYARLQHVGVADVLDTPGIDGLAEFWSKGADLMEYLFLALGAFAGFTTARKTAA
ncbi:hypothetical protein ACFWAR_16850 [Streptomyces sp. NPDC059917]|uniref:hypothetical protein n=1 Tax=Streptomyces sp. NPDC059917 TaxID=3347002 RepID=UPI003659CF36